MYLALLISLIALFVVVLTIVRNWKGQDGFWEKFGLIAFSNIVGFVVNAIVILLVGLFIGFFPAKTQTIESKVELAAISDGFSVGGSFFLGCGSIKGESYYFYYEKTKSGGYVQKRIKVEDAIIFEQDSTKTPCILFYERKFVNEKWEKWAFPCQSNTKIEIFVPKGSVEQNYSFDLE
jgi:hypothetical protein